VRFVRWEGNEAQKCFVVNVFEKYTSIVKSFFFNVNMVTAQKSRIISQFDGRFSERGSFLSINIYVTVVSLLSLRY